MSRVDVSNASSASVLSHAIHRGAGFLTLMLEEQFVEVALPPKHPPFVESLKGMTLVADLDREEGSGGRVLAACEEGCACCRATQQPPAAAEERSASGEAASGGRARCLQ